MSENPNARIMRSNAFFLRTPEGRHPLTTPEMLDTISDTLEDLREVANPPVPNRRPLRIMSADEVRMIAFADMVDEGFAEWDEFDMLVLTGEDGGEAA